MTQSPLFQPLSLGSLNLPNRVVMAPMTRSKSPGNIPNDAVVQYYQRRAAADVGLIITEGTCVGHKAASGYPDVPFMYGEESLAGWKRVVDAVHGVGGKIIPQLWHVGAIRRPGIEPDPEVPGYSPSGMARPGKVTGHKMSVADIDEVIAAFATAAREAMGIGFDGIEIHGAHGYLIDQFLWPGTNQRSDRYGQIRSQFGIDIIQAIRAEIPADTPLILRWSQWKMQDYNTRLAETPQQLEDFLTPLVEAGVDVFHCSQRRFWEAEFADSKLNLAGWVKKLTDRATITVGSVGLDAGFIDESKKGFAEAKPASLDELLERLAQQEFDLVAVGRALITNPDWAQKVKNADTDSLVPFDNAALTELI